MGNSKQAATPLMALILVLITWWVIALMAVAYRVTKWGLAA